MRRSNWVAISAILPLLSFVFQPAWIIGLGISMASSKSFDPYFKDSVYTPAFRRKTSVGLLILSILEGITGFGSGPTTSSFVSEITFDLLNRGLSLELHLALIIPLALLFVLHTVSGLGSLLLSKGVKNVVLYRYVIPAIWLVMYLVAVYLDLSYFIP
ncbi:hypothetical protein [Metallosphaera hakonensis]|uniref:Uncharacterized protein n=1 Tax=Metallosphaera hakonensis JCM 8857 = DSM 7519 TaxID=1293036 RepID=A0A2U9IRE9_9CREN|nr:hypothetical protein [Metallosphaera hakonensis]AWR98554.1 hypothetical protein DFR87_01250 [Metallosphaera hakonensis JCM 8857 = DSM 7519]